jgi:hypothetical protein
MPRLDLDSISMEDSMPRLTKFAAIGFALLLCLAGSALAAVPNALQYQGRLTDNTGAPLNGAFNVTFTIYSDSAGTTSLWTETRPLTIANGLFSVTLGTGVAIPASVSNGANRFIGIKVAPDAADMLPRQRLASVAFALRAGSADQLANVPGISNTEVLSTVAIPVAATVAVTSVTINCPADGYVLVSGLGTAVQTHVGGTDDWLMFDVSETSADVGFRPGFNQPITYAALPAATYFHTLNCQRIFGAAAGSHTYYLNGKHLSGPNGGTVQYPSLHAIYYPALYGTASAPPTAASAATVAPEFVGKTGFPSPR